MSVVWSLVREASGSAGVVPGAVAVIASRSWVVVGFECTLPVTVGGRLLPSRSTSRVLSELGLLSAEVVEVPMVMTPLGVQRLREQLEEALDISKFDLSELPDERIAPQGGRIVSSLLLLFQLD